MNILSPQILQWQGMTRHWYQWAIFGIMVTAFTIGIVYMVYTAIVRTVIYYKTRPTEQVLTKRAISYLDLKTTRSSRQSKPGISKPSSYSIYLGDFSQPPTPGQLDILQRSNLTIVNALAANVSDPIHTCQVQQFLGRIELDDVLSGILDDDGRLERLCDLIHCTFSDSSFKGLVLPGLERHFSSAYVLAILNFADCIGCNIFLEVRAPDFLQNHSLLSNPSIAGLILRNAVILPDGQHRDYFDMSSLQPTLRAFVRESCLRSFVVLAMEVHDTAVTVTNAVLKRGVQWCGFYSVTMWSGSCVALTDADANRSLAEPLGAFEWLKDERVMGIHTTWRNNNALTMRRSSVNEDAWNQISTFTSSAPNMLESLQKCPERYEEIQAVLPGNTGVSSSSTSHLSGPSLSESLHECRSFGCSLLGVEVSPLAFAEVVQAQVKLRDLGLLHPVDTQKTLAMGLLYRKFLDRLLLARYGGSSDIYAAVKELSTLIQTGHLLIHIGLNPGFKYGTQARFWGVYQCHDDRRDIFVSKDAQGIAGTVLHTFLSSKGFMRDVCFDIEAALSVWSKDTIEPHLLPRRVLQDIDLLTPQERLILLQQLRASSSPQNDTMVNIQTLVREKLIEGPSQSQLNEMNSVGYLSGSVSVTDLLKARFEWYEKLKIERPSQDAAKDFFTHLESALLSALGGRHDVQLANFTTALESILSNDELDACADLLGLATFCAARKAAFDEVYLEVTDRNPLFNDQPDQAAAFAESFALGSRCEVYFDVSPSVFGRLLSDRFRAHYNDKQPPSWINGAPDFATAYGGAQIDVDPDTKAKSLPQFQRFTFLSVFAIPALVDIALLTTTGRGLYLSAFMSLEEQNSATVALMISLLLSGATGTWIACGGSYYLISMAFSAMNVFVLTRLIAGAAFTIAGGLVGFAVMCGVQNIVSAVVFFLYFVAFTLYLILFAALASFQFPGSSFLSGRKMVIVCLPWLLISPIATMWSGHDVFVYLAIFYTVIGFLLISLRHIGSKWVTWYQDLRKTDDSEIRKWYVMNKAAGESKYLNAMTDPAALKISREALLEDIKIEIQKGIFKKPTTDKLVRELATDWEATNFLLDWYCRYSDVPRPIPFSSSWNIQTKVALQTLIENQKGIRLHSAFMHWRQAGDEVGCGILYFLVALLDKWVEMLSGVHLLGLSASLNSQFRTAVGFGLAYYLIGAVLIDVKAQDLHEAVAQSKPVGIETTRELSQHQKEEILARRSMYKQTLFRYLMWHSWSLAFSSIFVFILSDSLNGMVMFLSYVGAYTGLLWYQYTKIFSGPHALKPLLAAVCIGLPLGVILKKTMPDFAFSGVIALATATWTAAILCLWTAKLGVPKQIEGVIDTNERFHAHVRPWADPDWSQAELKSVYDRLVSLDGNARLPVIPRNHPGSEVVSILHAYQTENGLRKAFPDVSELVEIALRAWESGQIQIELAALSRIGSDIRALSHWTDGSMRLIVGVADGKSPTDIRSSCRTIAELLLHEVAEGYFNIPHEHAVLAEYLVCDDIPQNIHMMLASENKHEDILAWGRKEMLKQQCLGIDCDLHWERLPQSTRELFLRRSLGETSQVSQSDYTWISQTLHLPSVDEFNVHVARCDLALETIARCMDHAFTSPDVPDSSITLDFSPSDSSPTILWWLFEKPFSFVFHQAGTFIKFLVIAFIADLEFQREFEFKIRNQPCIIRNSYKIVMNGVWTYAKLMQDLCLPFFVFHGRKNVQDLWDDSKGMTITQRRNKLVVKSIHGETTIFRRAKPLGGFILCQYTGLHKYEPRQDTHLLKSVCTYSRSGEITKREEYADSESLNAYEYEYDQSPRPRAFLGVPKSRMPLSRRCVRGPKHMESIFYDQFGLVESGSYMVDGNLVCFKLHYRKDAQHANELLRGDFTMAHLSCTVCWCAPPRRNPERLHRWIPHTKVLSAKFTEGANVYESVWSYDHKFHPKITTKLNGTYIETPPMIEHDWLGVLKRPSFARFVDENPIFHSSFWNSNVIARWLGFATQRSPVSTSFARSRVWKAWKKGKDLDGVVVRILDEQLLRNDPVLKPYWRYRGRGSLETARKYLKDRSDAIMASADLDDEISSWTSLAFKLTDLFSFGAAGEAIINTKSQNVGHDTQNTLHVLAADNGTWPNEGGGVSACRRDMVNSLKSIRWHMLCESANDFGIPKHQTEKNVLSLKVIPLWGLDFLTPTHGLFKNRLDSEVDMVRTDATDLDIRRNFVPILTALVKGSRAIKLSNTDVKQATRALVRLNEYFSDKRHWSQVWTSDISKDAWRQLWLSQDMPNTKPSTEWLNTELPTLGHLDTAMELWLRYLFVFAIRVPDKLPAVFQTSHHSVSAAYGIICKIKRGCQLQIWDHAIAWRETNMCLSSTLCKLPPFVRNSLLGLMRLTSVLVLHHADVILPCADFFNPGWEVEIGTCQGTIEHRNSFKRKIAPVVNGITDAEKFKPVKEIITKQPTVTMLSHLWFCKDLKTAILAADIIVNEWGFKDYRLDIYGSIEKAPIYSNECQELLASKSLRGQVKLCGTADPMKVLEQTWLFLNSSLSEGLPLALGEAALTGAPVVCTDVGASLRVLSDPDDFSRYSAVVAPNDARALARAQIKMLGMLDEFGKYAGDDGPAPSMPFKPSSADVEAITARMYEKSEHRRKLGMMSRDIVQKSFGGERYLREHEQMLWIGKSQKLMQARIWGEVVPVDPGEVSQQIKVKTRAHEEVVPRSAATSWRSASPSSCISSRPVTPASAIHDARVTSSRLSERIRSTSRLSHATTAAECTPTSLTATSQAHEVTALPGSNNFMDLSLKRPTLGVRQASSSRSMMSKEMAMSPMWNRVRNGAYVANEKSELESSSRSPSRGRERARSKSRTRTTVRRPEMRYRSSDVSVIKLDSVGRWLTPMS